MQARKTISVPISMSRICHAFSSNPLKSDATGLREELVRATKSISGSVSDDEVYKAIINLGAQRNNEELIESCVQMANVFKAHAEDLKSLNLENIPEKIRVTGIKLYEFKREAKRNKYSLTKLGQLFNTIGSSIIKVVNENNEDELSKKELSKARRKRKGILQKYEAKGNDFAIFHNTPIDLAGYDIKFLAPEKLAQLRQENNISVEFLTRLHIVLEKLEAEAAELGTVDLERIDQSLSLDELEILLRSKLPQFENCIESIVPHEFLLELKDVFGELSDFVWKLFPDRYDRQMVKRMLSAKVAEEIELSDFSKPVPSDFRLPEFIENDLSVDALCEAIRQDYPGFFGNSINNLNQFKDEIDIEEIIERIYEKEKDNIIELAIKEKKWIEEVRNSTNQKAGTRRRLLELAYQPYAPRTNIPKYDLPTPKPGGENKNRPFAIESNMLTMIDKILDKAQREAAFEKAVDLSFGLLRRDYYDMYCDDRKGCFKAIRKERKNEKNSIRKAGLKKALKYYQKLAKFEKTIKGVREGKKLWPFQVEAVRRMVAQMHTILADEMGAGKTLETLMTAMCTGSKSIFIVCPDKAKMAWIRDIYKFIENPKYNTDENAKIKISLLGSHTSGLDDIIGDTIADEGDRRKDIEFESIRGGKKIHKFLENYAKKKGKKSKIPHFVIVNYENLIERNGDVDEESGITGKMKMLAKIKPDFLAVDEAHAIKNIKTAQSKHVRSIDALHKVLVTGTPLENRAEDLFAYLNFIAPHTYPSYEEFKEMYAGDDLGKMGELFQTLKKTMIRRKKDQILRDLPKKDTENIMLDFDSAKMRWNDETFMLDKIEVKKHKEAYEKMLYGYMKIEEEYQRLLNNSEKKSSIFSTKITRLRQMINDPTILKKIKAFKEIVSIKYLALDKVLEKMEEKFKKGEKVVIFSPSKVITRKLRERYEEKYGVAYMDGGTDKADRTDRIKSFQKEQKEKIFIATLGTGAESISLTAAATVIFFDKPLKSSIVDQAINRIHRIDKKRNKGRESIKIINLIVDAKNSIDIALENLIRRKRLISDIIIDGFFTPELRKELNELQDKIFEQFRIDAEKGLPIGSLANGENEYDDVDKEKDEPILTEAQKVMLTAFNKGWDAAAEGYARQVKNFASYWIDWFKARYLIDYCVKNGIKQLPHKMLFEGSGPSVAMRAWNSLESTVEKLSFSLPEGYDLDSSAEMLKNGISPNRILGDMVDPQIEDEFFDFIDNGSLHLVNHADRTKVLAEAHRMLKFGGLMTISTTIDKDVIGDKFIKGLKMLGFDIIAKVGLEPNKETMQALKKSIGPAKAGKIKEKMRGKEMVLIKKTKELNEDVSWQMFSFGSNEIDIAKRDVPINSSSDSNYIDLSNVDLTNFDDPLLELKTKKKEKEEYFKQDLTKLSKAELIKEIKDKLGALGLELEGKKDKHKFLDSVSHFLDQHNTLSKEEKAKMIYSLIELSRRLFPVDGEAFYAIIKKYGSSIDSIPEKELKELGLAREVVIERGHQMTHATPMLAYYFRKLLKELLSK
ncbi:SNF2-related protein [Candidatus Margulisiibacteriota bacterium]